MVFTTKSKTLEFFDWFQGRNGHLGSTGFGKENLELKGEKKLLLKMADNHFVSCQPLLRSNEKKKGDQYLLKALFFLGKDMNFLTLVVREGGQLRLGIFH